MRLVAYTDASEVGGAEHSLGHLLTELDRAIDVTVMGPSADVLETVAAQRPAAALRVVATGHNKADLAAIARHVRTLRSIGADLLHVNLQSPWSGQFAIAAGLLLRVPVVLVEQLPFASTSELQRRIRRFMCGQVAAHVAVGERAARRIERLIGLDENSVMTIHNGVPDIVLTPVAPPAPGPLIGAVGRLSDQKGFDVLLRALPRVPASTLVIVGDGPERQRLEGLAHSLGVADRVLITGWTERPRNYLPVFDVVAQPSRYEGFPLAIVEAMLASRAIVASNVDSIPEAIEDGVTGRLVDPDDPVALAEAISGLLDDPSLRGELGARARERAAERFTAAAMARSYERLYASLLG